ncbi:polymorphic toxin type 24 domain-containing protein [Hydromonas duriensis]|uniref:Putative RNase toxin 24 of polymorphic toxin system n=1 Tax=Hydromonas duriensis TaxID=1527608 RepID=A0A4R6Y0P2_9BURK|nr:putative RNase toxin 24 of polymorphic toxin system [Hydromonas duriensis]
MPPKIYVTSYAAYDSNGMIVKRVDMTGASHAGVPTPHVIEYGRNVLPNGQVRVQTPRGNLICPHFNGHFKQLF